MTPREQVLAAAAARDPEWLEETMEIGVGGWTLTIEIKVREVPGGYQLVMIETERGADEAAD